MRRLVVLLLALGCLAEGETMARSTGEAQPEPPREVGLVEAARRRLVQLDVSVAGPPETIANLRAGDFQLTVGGRPVEDFYADRVCGGQPPPATLADSAAFERTEDSGTPIVGVNYLIYFDHNHLTFEGRRRSLEVARSLIEELILAPNRAMVVASGQRVQTLTGWTSNRSELLAALDLVEQTPEQGDFFPMREDDRVLRVQEMLEAALDEAAVAARFSIKQDQALNRAMNEAGYDGPGTNWGRVAEERNSGVQHAKNLARTYQREEKWHTERALTRFKAVLSRLATIPPPKAVIYFADRMRSNAGDHYTYLVRRSQSMGVDIWTGRLPVDPELAITHDRVGAFDQVLDEAAAHGVRLYTVQAEGIVSGYRFLPTSNQTFNAGSAAPLAANRRFAEANASLAAFALETGGRTFLNGARPENIVAKLRSDLDCFYILSFEAEGLPEDRALSVLVHVTRPDVEANTRGRLVIKSESARLQSELMAAFVAPREAHSGPPIRGTVIPLGFDKDEYSALVQVVVPGSARPSATWDLGVSLVSGTRAAWKASRRLVVASPGVPVILEIVTPFAPGPYDLVLVANEVGTEQISTGHLEGAWPWPSEGDASVGPVALLQPGTGAFVRDGEVRRQGPVAPGALARTDLPTALVGIVCRSGKEVFRVERSLVGASSAAFPPLELDGTKNRCSVFSDAIPANTLTAGKFRYEVRVVRDGTQVASREREFMAAAASDLDRPASAVP